MTPRTRTRMTVAALALCGAASLAVAQPAAPETAPAAEIHAPVVTRHSGVFNGVSVRYTATVEETATPGARLVSTAYTADGADPAKRPVIFLFNGGPIAPSDILHMVAFGPRRLAIPADLKADPAAFRTVDNPYTVLDVADLVFIDPASTGFSRVSAGKRPEDYFSVVADGQQVSDFIAGWLRAHGRLASPKYVFGESYGTIRAAEVADLLAKAPEPVALDGVFLMGQALNIVEFSQRPGNVVSYMVSLPTLAAIAWYHGKVDKTGMTFPRFLDAARRFARTNYLDALVQGDQIEPATAGRVAADLQRFTGVPAAFYLANGLRITKERFRTQLLKDQGLVLGLYDARYTASPQSRDNASDASAAIEPAIHAAFRAYLRADLEVDWSEPYITASPVRGLDGWGWGATTPFSDWPYMDLIGDAMRREPHLRVLMGIGYFDTSTTTGATEYALAQSGWPKDRRGIVYYEGGHMAYTNEAALKKLTSDVRAFVTGPKHTSPGGRGRGPTAKRLGG